MEAYVYQKYPRPYQLGGRIPKAYPEKRFRKWLPEDRDIARLPSTIASTITTGPTRTISPQSPSIMHDVFPRGLSELRGKCVNPQNRKEFRAYDPRAHAPFVKMAHDRLRLLPQIVRRNRMLVQRLFRQTVGRK